MDIVTLREFSRRIGVSLTAVQKGVKTGRIKAITDSTGRITGIDCSTQSAAWEDNCKAPQRRAHNQSGGRPRNDGKPVAAPKTAPKKTREGEVVEARDPQPHGGALKRSTKTPPPEGQMSMAEAQRARELIKLQTDSLNLKERQGELVKASDQKAAGFKLGQTLISNLYNMPERLSDEFAGMSDPAEIHALWLKELDKAVSQIRGEYGC